MRDDYCNTLSDMLGLPCVAVLEQVSVLSSHTVQRHRVIGIPDLQLPLHPECPLQN